MTLNYHEPQNIGFYWILHYFRLRRTLGVNFRRNYWRQQDKINMRTKLNWCCRASHELIFLVQLGLKHFTRDSCTRHVLLRARMLWQFCPSVWRSVTTRYRCKARWDTDSGFSPYDSLESLASNEVIWCRWVTRLPSNEGIKEGYPRPLEIVILPLLARFRLAWKRLHIDTDVLLTITSTADELSGGTNIDDLEVWTTLNPQNRGF